MTIHPIRPHLEARADQTGGNPSRDAALGDEMRRTLSGWPAGVTVVSVRDDDEVLALTVGSFTSVSLNPPLLLICIGENAGILPSLLDVGRFTVNLLVEGQERIAALMAEKLPPDAALFAGEGDPLLSGALASIVCSVEAEHPAGDRRIVVGRVERIVPGSEAAPLVRFRREYRGLR